MKASPVLYYGSCMVTVKFHHMDKRLQNTRVYAVFKAPDPYFAVI